MEPTVQHHNLSTLFYYDIQQACNKGLRKGLREYRFLLTILKSALYHFENRDLDRFDSLVGENACQIRAIKIAILASSNQIDTYTLTAKINVLSQKLDELLSETTIHRLMSSGISLNELLIQENLDLTLSTQELFVFLSFLLSEMKTPQPTSITSLIIRDKSDHKNIKRFDAEISSHFTDNLASKARKLLAHLSINSVRKFAWESGDRRLIRMVSDDFTQHHNTLPCIPMFWTYKVLLKAAQRKSIPMLVHARFVKEMNGIYIDQGEEMLFFKPLADSNYSYCLQDATEDDLAHPACIIQGIVLVKQSTQFCKMRWKEQFSQYSLTDMILAGAADHRQYPSDSLTVSVTDHDYERYKAMARSHGHSLDNPSLFFINHVYPQLPGKMLSDKSRAMLAIANS